MFYLCLDSGPCSSLNKNVWRMTCAQACVRLGDAVLSGFNSKNKKQKHYLSHNPELTSTVSHSPFRRPPDCGPGSHHSYPPSTPSQPPEPLRRAGSGPPSKLQPTDPLNQILTTLNADYIAFIPVEPMHACTQWNSPLLAGLHTAVKNNELVS